MATESYISLKFNGQASLCPPDTTSAQSSMDKRRYVHQKLGQLKVQRSNRQKLDQRKASNQKLQSVL